MLSPAAESDRLSVVVITRDRREAVLDTLPRLLALPEHPRVVLVDNASSDSTAAEVRRRHPQVDVAVLEENLGAAARTVGVRRTSTPYVAFSDDDSWWDPGALRSAAEVLDRVPRLGVLAGRVLVGTEGRLDPVCAQMQRSLLGAVPGAGPRVLGFVACGAVVRVGAYLNVKGFHPRYGVGGEESLLTIDLTERGWECAYVDTVVARHHPSPLRDPASRRAREVRNALWTSWLRRPASSAAAATVRSAASLGGDTAVRTGLRQALGGWRWVLQEREPVTAGTEHRLRLLEREG